jgi:hypothetical protein
MHYVATIRGVSMPRIGWRERLAYLVLWFIPRANPDNEPLYPRVARWLLELDESGQAVREIGIDASGAPLFSAPNKRNFGFFTDSSEKFSAADLVPIDEDEFQNLWEAVSP